MASSINADNGVSSGSAGLKSTADSSGVLALQTNGTTAISIDASQAVSFTNQPTYSGGTANGVAYLNGSKVLTTGSALVFDGSNLGIANTSMTSFYNGGRQLVVGSGSGSQGMSIYAGSANDSGIYFARGLTGNDPFQGQLVYSHNVDAMRFYTAATERMRLDSSGNVGIGTTSPAARLQVEAASGFVARFGSNTNAAVGIRLFRNGTNSGEIGSADALFVGGSSSEFGLTTPGANALLFGTNGSERARITSGGNLLVGTTGLPIQNGKLSVSASSGEAARLYQSGGDSLPSLALDKSSTTNTTSQVFAIFTINDQSTGSGQINANGASQAAFGSFSDRRLKENIVDLSPQLANIMALRPVEFDYIESEGGGHQISFVAQEFEQVYPDAIGERADGMKTLTGWGKTEARLVKAIQEQQAIIQSLTARVTALEGA